MENIANIYRELLHNVSNCYKYHTNKQFSSVEILLIAHDNMQQCFGEYVLYMLYNVTVVPNVPNTNTI